MANERDKERLGREAQRAADRGDLGAAAECYRQLVALAPGDLSLLGKYADALARTRRPEARDAFRRLGEACLAQGHRSRALAALRRAAKAGEPDPGILESLGRLSLESGLLGDAREPLLAAGRLREEGRDFAEARRIYLLAAEALRDDPAPREALVRIADAFGDPQERARTRVELARVHARLGRSPAALAAFTSALEIDAASASIARAITEITRALHDVDPDEIPAAPASKTPAVVAAWSVLRASVCARAGRREEVIAALERFDADEVGAAPPLALAAASSLLEVGELDATERCARRALEGPLKEPLYREALASLLNALVARDPSRSFAIEALMRIEDAPGPAWSGPEGGDEKAAAASGEAALADEPGFSNASAHELAIPEEADDADAAGLPDGIRARLFEVDSLIEHGLLKTAERVLKQIPPSYQGHPKVDELWRLITEARERAEERSRRAAGPSQREPGGSPGEASGGDDDWVMIVDPDSDDPVTGIVTSAEADANDTGTLGGGEGGEAEPGAEPAAEGALPPVPAPPPAGSQLGADAIEKIDEDDAETSYQAGLGFVEMGLHEQAQPLLERALRHVARAADAALLLMRVHRERGDLKAAYAAGYEGYRASEGAEPGLRGEVVAEMAEICLSLGNRQLARGCVATLSSIAPGHPRLEGLAARVE